MSYNYETHRNKLAVQWVGMKILRQRPEMERVARKLVAKKAVYQEAEKATGVPWWMIAVIDLREGGESHLGTRHLHCGDPLTNYTVHVPVGRPKVGHEPPFTWLESAVDALKMKLFDKVKDWTIERVLHELEPYNGLGYFQKGIPSPYIWSCTSIYDPPNGPGGKYVADHVFDPHAVDSQVGCAPLIRVLADLDKTIVLRSWTDKEGVPREPMPPLPPSPPAHGPSGPIHTGVFAGIAAAAAAASRWLADFDWSTVGGIVAIVAAIGFTTWLIRRKK